MELNGALFIKGWVCAIASAARTHSMAQPPGIRYEAGFGDVLGQLTEQQHREREANAAAVAVVRDYKKTEGPVTTAEGKKALIDEGYKAKRRYHEKRLLLQDPSSVGVGEVLKRQTPLLRREMYRRRLFPIRFEETAADVEAANHLAEKQPVGRLVVALVYLAMLLFSLSYALEITKIFEGSDGIRASIQAALAPTPSNFNSISFQASTAFKSGHTLTDIVAPPVSGRPADLAALNSKAGVAAWLLYGFVPLLYGQTSHTSNMGSARVIGNCFRLTFRQVRPARLSSGVCPGRRHRMQASVSAFTGIKSAAAYQTFFCFFPPLLFRLNWKH